PAPAPGERPQETTAPSPPTAAADIAPETVLPPAEGPPPAPGPAPPPEHLPGARPGTPAGGVNVPGYEVLSVLGRGGMGIVYKARQVKANRTVALKMILASRHAGPQEKMRFRIEARAVARLQHPHIVQVYEVGEHDGLPFFS